MKLLIKVILIMIFAFTATTGYAQTKLTFPVASLSPTAKIYEAFIKQAYQQIGIEVQYKEFPFERALKLSNEGKSDGEIFRISGLTKVYPNLIPVPVKILSFYAHAYSKNKDLKVNGMESIKSLKIGVLRGVKMIEVLTKELKPHVVNNVPAVFGILKKDRVDIVLLIPIIGDAFLQSQPDFAMIHRIDPPVAEISLFHYLHKKNQHLIPKIQPIFEKMAADKVLDKMLTRAKTAG